MILSRVIRCRPWLRCWLLAFLMLSGCDGSQQWEGEYQGFFQALGGSHPIPKQRVKIRVRNESKLQILVSISNEKEKLIALVPVKIKTGRQMALDLRNLGLPPLRLLKQGDCFESHGETEGRLCQNGTDFIFDIFTTKGDVLLSLSALKVSDRPLPAYEVPKSISFGQGRQRVIRSNFESRIQLENQIQAKLHARKAFLDLAPRLTYNSVAALVSYNINSIFEAVGDLLPFLFPSRWIAAYQSQWLAAAQNDALFLIRADLVLQYEGLYYSLRQLSDCRRLYERAIVQVAEIQTIMKKRLKPTADSGALLEEVALELLKLQTDQRIFLQAQQSALIAISHSLGFQNPMAVEGIENYPYQTDPNRSVHLDFKNLSQVALNRSLELKQLDSLAHAAEMGIFIQYFSWLDPAASGLSFGMIPLMGVAKSQLREVTLKKEQMTSRLLGYLQDIENNLETFQDTYPFAKRRVRITAQRVERLSAGFLASDSQDPDHLLSAITAKLEAEVALSSMENNHSLLFTRLRRLLFDRGYNCLSISCRREDLLEESFLIP